MLSDNNARLLVLAMAENATIVGMHTENQVCIFQGIPQKYTEDDFFASSSSLHAIAMDMG